MSAGHFLRNWKTDNDRSLPNYLLDIDLSLSASIMTSMDLKYRNKSLKLIL